MSEECWGPWIDHVPGPCPVPVGTWICALHNSGLRCEGRIVAGEGAFGNHHPAWLGKGADLITRYRIRGEREHSGMAVLRKALTGLPVKEKASA